MKILFLITFVVLGANRALATTDCVTEKEVATAWIQGKLGIENETFNKEFAFQECADEGYIEVVAVIFESPTLICAIDVDLRRHSVIAGNRGCYKKIQ